jgi:hypothetical protein
MIDKALLALRPGAAWSLNGDTYEGLVWMDTAQSCPSREEINVEVQRLQAEWDSKEYQRLRAKEYPSFAEQFDLLYHGGYDAWKASIDEVKAKYPKGEA